MKSLAAVTDTTHARAHGSHAAIYFIYLNYYTFFEYNKKISFSSEHRCGLSLAVFYVCVRGNKVFWLDARAISFARVLLGALGALGALDVAAPVELAAALPVPGELVRVVAPAAAQHPAPFSP